MNDLEALYDQIATATSANVALRYLQRVRAYLDSFDLASERGSSHSEVRPGLRIVGFERRLTVAFAIDEHVVTIVRIFRAGEDWGSAF